VIRFLTENGEMEALASLNRLDIAWVNELMVIFTQFVTSVEGHSVSYFDIFRMLQKLMVHSGSLHANKHAKTIVQTLSGHFSRTTNLNVIFIYCLMTPAGKKYYRAIE
jgi:hypothetical protein